MLLLLPKIAKFAAVKTPPLKILLLGDASNYHATLALGLRRLGHEVTVMSDGSRWQKTARDIDISRPFKGKIGGGLLWLDLMTRRHRSMSGYDIVQVATPFFVSLRPERLLTIFNRLKRENGAVFSCALGTDPFYVRECLDPTSPIRYNEWRLFDRPGPLALADPVQMQEWLAPDMLDYTAAVYDRVDGITTVLWEYQAAVERVVDSSRVGYVGLPIDVGSISFNQLSPAGDAPLNLFLGRHSYRQAEKGTDLLEKAARRVVDRSKGRAVFTLVEDRPYDEYCALLDGAHVVLDQIYSYTPATNALLAMARGKIAVSGAEPEFYDFIGEHRLRPVINAPVTLDELTATLMRLVDNREMIGMMSRDSRRFVEKHHDCVTVAQRAVDFWTKKAGG